MSVIKFATLNVPAWCETPQECEMVYTTAIAVVQHIFASSADTFSIRNAILSIQEHQREHIDRILDLLLQTQFCPPPERNLEMLPEADRKCSVFMMDGTRVIMRDRYTTQLQEQALWIQRKQMCAMCFPAGTDFDMDRSLDALSAIPVTQPEFLSNMIDMFPQSWHPDFWTLTYAKRLMWHPVIVRMLGNVPNRFQHVCPYPLVRWRHRERPYEITGYVPRKQESPYFIHRAARLPHHDQLITFEVTPLTPQIPHLVAAKIATSRRRRRRKVDNTFASDTTTTTTTATAVTTAAAAAAAVAEDAMAMVSLRLSGMCMICNTEMCINPTNACTHIRLCETCADRNITGKSADWQSCISCKQWEKQERMKKRELAFNQLVKVCNQKRKTVLIEDGENDTDVDPDYQVSNE